MTQRWPACGRWPVLTLPTINSPQSHVTFSRLSFFLFIHISIYKYICRTIFQSIQLSIYLSIYLFALLFIHLSIQDSQSLQKLFLENNSLSSLSPETLNGLGDLLLLNLSRNALTSHHLDNKMFASLTKVNARNKIYILYRKGLYHVLLWSFYLLSSHISFYIFHHTIRIDRDTPISWSRGLLLLRSADWQGYSYSDQLIHWVGWASECIHVFLFYQNIYWL